MDNKIKKIIAREGLVILTVVALGGGLIFLSTRYPFYPVAIRTDIKTGRPLTLTSKQFDKLQQEGFAVEKIASFEQRRLTENCDKTRNNLSLIGFLALVGGYPLYLLIRFILWASKTLKQKE